MKKNKIHITRLGIAFFLLLLLLGVSQAGQIQLLKSATSTGVGAAYDNRSSGFQTVTCDVVTSDNTTSAIKVRLEGNQDCGTKYSPTGMCEYPLTATEMVSYIGTFTCVGMPSGCLRANLVTLTGGTSPAVSVVCTGVK